MPSWSLIRLPFEFRLHTKLHNLPHCAQSKHAAWLLAIVIYFPPALTTRKWCEWHFAAHPTVWCNTEVICFMKHVLIKWIEQLGRVFGICVKKKSKFQHFNFLKKNSFYFPLCLIIHQNDKWKHRLCRGLRKWYNRLGLQGHLWGFQF